MWCVLSGHCDLFLMILFFNVQWLTHINIGDPVYSVVRQSELTQFEWKSLRNDKAS